MPLRCCNEDICLIGGHLVVAFQIAGGRAELFVFLDEILGTFCRREIALAIVHIVLGNSVTEGTFSLLVNRSIGCCTSPAARRHVRVLHSLIQALGSMLVQDSSNQVLGEGGIHFLGAVNKDILFRLSSSLVVIAIITPIGCRSSEVQMLVIVREVYLLLSRVLIVFSREGGGWL